SFEPKTGRNFYLFFELAEVDPRLAEALEFFVWNVLLPGDGLTLITPVKTYRMKPESIDVLPKPKLVEQLTGLVRRDVVVGHAEYRDAVDELAAMAKTLASAISMNAEHGDTLDFSGAGLSGHLDGLSLEDLLARYLVLLEKLQSLRRLDEKTFHGFAETLKSQEGRKYVYLFYQQEFLPLIEPRILYQYMDLHQGQPAVLTMLSDIAHFAVSSAPLDVAAAEAAYADASTAVHFMFLTRRPEDRPNVRFEERGADLFAPFREMAEATGGLAQSSANPVFLMKKAVQAAENYYLLYYAPRGYAADGAFKTIRVRVKPRGCEVSHRSGYFAR
ncbi:MAG: hypothetical protein JW742_04120, partial [Candidatus Aminicenantes bacterium]|nr:hypothetical protein [Candidatus Aminicenantes bacterium]